MTRGATPAVAGQAAPLVVEQLSCGYVQRAAPLVAGLDLRLAPGEAVAIVGPNGAGKTTLLRTVAGLVHPLSGRVLLGGVDVKALQPEERARRVALLSQEAGEAEGFTVRELVELGRTPHLGLWGALRPTDAEAVDEALELCGLAALAPQRLDELSGGERQRARVALAVAQHAPLLLLDEPASHLDLRRRHELFTQLARLRTDRGLAMLLVLHDLVEAYREAQRVLVLAEGRAEEIPAGDPQRVEKLARCFGVPAERIVV
jgi:iron complex transport system ATP-binding protein